LTLKIAPVAAGLARYPGSSACYLRGRTRACVGLGGAASPIVLEDQAATLEAIAERGGDDFIVVRSLTNRRRFRNRGSRLSFDDLAAYRAEITPIEALRYRDASILTSSALTAGPALTRALSLFARQADADGTARPDARFFSRIADALTQTYAERIGGAAPGDDARRGTCTTHISVVDRHGNAVALTQTLLSMSGSKVTLPQTGIVMNNAVMWFDPRPGSVNSIMPGAVPLSNMCLTVVKRATGDVLALGASGGRRIMPAVMQLGRVSGRLQHVDRGRDSLPASRCERRPVVTIDDRFDASGCAGHRSGSRSQAAANLVAPNLSGCPNVVLRDGQTRQLTGALVSSPWSAAARARRTLRRLRFSSRPITPCTKTSII
jgi:gamma-glutamyltranspeptidase/glutathione hydrolase